MFSVSTLSRRTVALAACVLFAHLLARPRPLRIWGPFATGGYAPRTPGPMKMMVKIDTNGRRHDNPRDEWVAFQEKELCDARQRQDRKARCEGVHQRERGVNCLPSLLEGIAKGELRDQKKMMPQDRRRWAMARCLMTNSSHIRPRFSR